MADYTTTKGIIDSNIITNHNEEITAFVTNMVMTAMIDYTRTVNFAINQAISVIQSNIGVLATLGTVDKTNLVNAINEVLAGGGGGLIWDSPTAKSIGYWNGITLKINNSKIGNHGGGVMNTGAYIAKTKKGDISGDVQLKEAEHFIYTMTGNVNFKFDDLTLADDESAVFTIQLTGQFAFSFPAGVVAQPYNDTYNGTKVNYLTVVITETISGAVKGYYNLITST